MWLFLFLTFVTLAAAAVSYRKARDKNLDVIFADALMNRRAQPTGTVHVFFCLVDHYEPFWEGPPRGTAVDRVVRWQDGYPRLVDGLRDRSGRCPQHTFFYPQEEYDEECMSRLSALCRKGYGDVEVHLHHDNDTSEGFRHKIETFTTTLRNQHGLLRTSPATGKIQYGFIHGNWALDNSRPDRRMCGVNDEITILSQTGCYADFTFPSAPDPTQPPTINQIYYATDDPNRPCSHHRGHPVTFGGGRKGDLLMITGPLTVNWRSGRFMPAVENADVAGHNPPTHRRIDLWVDRGIHVAGYPNWTFVKVHTHGAQDDNADMLLGKGGANMYRYLLDRYNDGEHHVLHFVTAYEMYRCVKALEAGDREAIVRIEDFDYGRNSTREGV